jgi:hypothetical protein
MLDCIAESQPLLCVAWCQDANAIISDNEEWLYMVSCLWMVDISEPGLLIFLLFTQYIVDIEPLVVFAITSMRSKQPFPSATSAVLYLFQNRYGLPLEKAKAATNAVSQVTWS